MPTNQTVREYLEQNARRFPSGNVFPFSDFFWQLCLDKKEKIYLEFAHYQADSFSDSTIMMQLRTNEPLIIFQWHYLNPKANSDIVRRLMEYARSVSRDCMEINKIVCPERSNAEQ